LSPKGIFRQDDPPTELQLRRDKTGFTGMPKAGKNGVLRIDAFGLAELL
jgi:hypothetical protein